MVLSSPIGTKICSTDKIHSKIGTDSRGFLHGMNCVIPNWVSPRTWSWSKAQLAEDGAFPQGRKYRLKTRGDSQRREVGAGGREKQMGEEEKQRAEIAEA